MTTPTSIALLDFDTAPADRRSALEQLQREQPRSRRCRDASRSASSSTAGASESGISVIHEWVDQPSFAKDLASDAFARSNERLRPIMVGPPTSRRFRAESVETVG